MSMTLPVIKGQMGRITFYESTMKARELGTVRIASELDDWASMGLEERMQREVNIKRVIDEIVPYLRKSPDRFTGSVIVLVKNAEEFRYESLKELNVKIPGAYSGPAARLGFLSIEGGEMIFLDGQHRGAAYREVVNPRSGASVEGTEDVANDDVCVIFVPFESSEQTRRIFNKVNRYARSTSKADNIITSEDDGYAIVSRKLFTEGGPLYILAENKKTRKTELAINLSSNTISERSTQFTTTSAIYEIVKEILKANGIKDFDEKSRVIRPEQEEIDEAYEFCEELWDEVIDGVNAYNQVINNVDADGLINTEDLRAFRVDTAETSLLFKPAGQIALFRGLLKAVKRGVDQSSAIQRVNNIDWSMDSDVFQGSIVRGGRMSTKNEDYELASEMIAYMVASEKMDEDAINILRRKYHESRNGKIDLSEFDDDFEYEELPEAIA
jgi:DNA sulfur modification protein DndB